MATRNSLIQFIALFPAETTSSAVPELETKPIVPETVPVLAQPVSSWANEEPDLRDSPMQVYQPSGTKQTKSNNRDKGKKRETTPRPEPEKSNKQPGPIPRANTKVTIIKNTYNKDSSWTSGDVLKPIYTHSSKPKTLEINFSVLNKMESNVVKPSSGDKNSYTARVPIMLRTGNLLSLHPHTQETVNNLVTLLKRDIGRNKISYVVIPYLREDNVKYDFPRDLDQKGKHDISKAINESGITGLINNALTAMFFSDSASYIVYENNAQNNVIQQILANLNGNAGEPVQEPTSGSPQVHVSVETKSLSNVSGTGNKTKKVTGLDNNIITRLSPENKASYDTSIKLLTNKTNPASKNDRQQALNILERLGLDPNYKGIVGYTSNKYNISIVRRGRGRGPGSGRGNSSTGRGRRVVPAGIISKVTICKNTFISDSTDTHTGVVFNNLADSAYNRLCIVFGKKTDSLVKDATKKTPYIQYTIPLYTIKDDNTIDAIEYTQTTLNTLFTDLAKYIADNNIGFVLIPYTGNTYITVLTSFGKLDLQNKDKLLDTFRSKAIDGKTIYSMINEAIYYTFDNHPNNYDIVYNPEDSASMHIEHNKKFIELPSTTQPEKTEIKPSNMSHANNAVNTETKKEYNEILNKLVNLNKADNGYNTIRADLERKLTDILKDPGLLKFHKAKFNIKDTNTLIPDNVKWSDLDD